jgi:hypothetical protein
MSKFLRLAAVVLCLGVLALGVVPLTYPPRWDSGKGASVAEEVARNGELDQREAAIRRRREAKAQVAKEVIARRQSLAEAIERFRALDREWPENHLGPRTPKDFGMSEDEWDGREVVRFVQLVLADRPDEAAPVADRLGKELRELVAERSKLRLAPAEPRAERNR